MAVRFQRLLDSATDQVLVEPNWEGILECVDMIRGSEVPVKDALKSIQKRYHNVNPHIAHHALLVLEACVKNCGRKFIAEIATKEFMEDLKNLIVSSTQDNVRTKVLELIQCWTSAFKGIPDYKIVGDTHSLLKMNGFEFPPIDEAKAMFLAESAPDWAEGDNCYRCRAEFGVFTRKHHCRACGQIFCDRCSSKQMLLPNFGIEKKVRVCEACFDKKQTQQASKEQGKSPLDSKTEEEAREKALKDAEAKEQEEFELALAISQSEAEAKEAEKRRSLYHNFNGVNSSVKNEDTGISIGSIGYTGIAPTKTDGPAASSIPNEEISFTGMMDDSQDQPFDSVLAKYLDRDYWERKRRETEEQAQRTATAPPPSEISISISSSASQQNRQNGTTIPGRSAANNMTIAADNAPAPPYETQNQLDFSPLDDDQQTIRNGAVSQIDEIARNYSKMNMIGTMANDGLKDGFGGSGEEVAETSQFCRVLKERVETMNNRMKSNQLRGRSIVNDSAIHSLFSQLTDLHATVLQRMTKFEEQREHYERLQDHLAHIQEARQAINALREENTRQHQERLREEQNRRQAQLRQKLEMMRHKKHEMLMSGRYAAIQRFQEQERQIRQQRGTQQQSPQTVRATVGVHMPMPPMGMGEQSSMPPSMVTQAATTQILHQIPSSQMAPQYQLQQTTPTASPQQAHQQQNQYIQQIPTSTFTMSSGVTTAPQFSVIPQQTFTTAPYPGHNPPPMSIPYSMQPPAVMTTPPTSHQQPMAPYMTGSPQMMYAAYHHPTSMGIPGQPHHIGPMQMHPPQYHQMPSYQQYMPASMPPPPQQIHHQQPIQGQHGVGAGQEQVAAKETIEVPEDLLISFD